MVIIPDGVSSIGDNIFMGCSGLRHVHVPAATTYVPTLAFASAGCPDGLEITGMENVTILDMWSFENSTVKALPECPKLQHFGASVFRKSSLEHFKFNDGSIANSSIFNECTNLKSVYFPTQFSYESPYFSGHSTVELIRVYNPIPPQSNHDIYHEVSPNCVLEVPEESVEAYRQASVWRAFPDIRPIGSTAIKGIDANRLNINVSGGCLSVSGAENVSIYDLTGRLIHHGEASVLPLPHGMYLIVADGITRKVMI